MSFEQDEITTSLIRNNKPLQVPNVNMRHEIWFMQRIVDQIDGTRILGEIIAMDESSAWFALQPHDLHGKGAIKKPTYRIYGVGIPNAYIQATEDAKKIVDQDPLEQRRLRGELLKKALIQSAEDCKGVIKRPANANIRDFNGEIQKDPRVLAELQDVSS